MQVKTISYKRILNLGNYESKHLEIFIDIHEGDDVEAETSYLMELVERKIREDIAASIELELRQLKSEVRKLTEAKQRLEAEIKSIESTKLEDCADNETATTEQEIDDF